MEGHYCSRIVWTRSLFEHCVEFKIFPNLEIVFSFNYIFVREADFCVVFCEQKKDDISG